MAKDSLTTFFVDGLHSYVVHVKPEAEEVINALGRDVIHFRRVLGEDKAAFATASPAVAKYLRAEKDHLAETIREDLRKYQALRCPQCDFTTEGNTAADQQALAKHIADEHDLDAQEPVTSKPKLEERVPQVETAVEPKAQPASNVKAGKITAGQ